MIKQTDDETLEREAGVYGDYIIAAEKLGLNWHELGDEQKALIIESVEADRKAGKIPGVRMSADELKWYVEAVAKSIIKRGSKEYIFPSSISQEDRERVISEVGRILEKKEGEKFGLTDGFGPDRTSSEDKGLADYLKGKEPEPDDREEGDTEKRNPFVPRFEDPLGLIPKRDDDERPFTNPFVSRNIMPNLPHSHDVKRKVEPPSGPNPFIPKPFTDAELAIMEELEEAEKKKKEK